MNQETMDNRAHPQSHISVGDWVITLLIAAIPIVNLVMLFVWGFGGNTPASKANWAKATLIWMVIGIVLSVLFVMVIGGLSALVGGSM